MIEKYHTRRYRTDPEFRARVLASIHRYHSRIKERNWAMSLSPEDRLRCPYCGWVWRPRYLRVPSKCPSCVRKLIKLPEVVK